MSGALRWYAHRELPRFGRLLRLGGTHDQPRWTNAPTVDTRGRFHGHHMRLDLSDFFQRAAYYFGAYHELDILSTCAALLRAGEAFIDGGANIGLVSLHAAALVGPAGRIDAFECSPTVLEQLRHHVSVNKLAQIHIHEVGLSDEPGELTFRLPHRENQAAATFASVPARYGDGYIDLGKARLVRGDDVLDPSDDRPLLIKLDIEGFELRALRGLASTIERRRPALLTEVNEEMLTHAGVSVDELTQHLMNLGYKPWALERGGFRTRHRLRLHPLLAGEISLERDILWLLEGTAHWDRATPFMAPRGIYWRHKDIARRKRQAEQAAQQR